MPTDNLKQVDVQGYTRTVNGSVVTVHGYAHGVAAGNGNSGHIRRQARRGDPQRMSELIAPTGVHPLTANRGQFTQGHFRTAALPFSFRTGWGGAMSAVMPSASMFMPLAGELLLSASSDDWTAATQMAFDHVLLVMGNNPGRPMSEIVKRPDVQQALQYAGDQGANAVINRLQQVWDDNGGPAQSDYLERVFDTMRTNGATFPRRMSAALSDGDRDQVNNILLKDRLRASAAESVVATRARAERTLSHLRLAGATHVMWQAHVDDKTCSTCLLMDGKVAPIGAGFSVEDIESQGLRYYGGGMVLPPIHPHCRCYIVGVKS